MMLSVISAVAIIYSIVIVYLPAMVVLQSNIEEAPKMCTTLSKRGNISDEAECAGWWACEEWCLSKVRHDFFCFLFSLLDLQYENQVLISMQFVQPRKYEYKTSKPRHTNISTKDQKSIIQLGHRQQLQ